MKTHLLISVLWAIMIPAVLRSQDSGHLSCISALKRDQLLKAHPEILLQEQAAEAEMKQWIAEYRKAHTEKSNQGRIIIPLVFHILNEGGSENISDAQVIDEVRILNRDYNKQNADTSEAVADFPNIIADMGVTWRLANIDPNGNCTNGIDRITTDQTNIGDDYSKLNGWDRSKYVNVWVARQFDLTPGAAGYAYYATDVQNQYSTPWMDGVILINSYIGGTNIPLQFTGSDLRSRALTHEIGHCFDLEHTWGSTNAPGVACGDDGVDDTPITKGYLGPPCPTPAQAMICTPGVVENYQNYMEYSYCSVMFTEGQKERWIAAANSNIADRINLWQDSNLIATGTYDTFVNPCAPIANFSVSGRYICSGNSTQFLNSSGNGDGFTYQWDIPNGTFVSGTSDTSRDPIVQFNALGWQTIKLTVSNSLGSSTKTDSTLLFVGYDIAQVTAPYYEGFDDPDVFRMNGWVSVNYDANNKYDNNVTWFTQQSAGYRDGGGAAMLNNYDAHANWDVDEMISPPVDLSILPQSQMNLSFYYSCATAIASYSGLYDSLSVQASNDCGLSWSQIYKMGGATLDNAGYVDGRFVPTPLAGYWKKVNIPLNQTVFSSNRSDILFKFQAFTTVQGNNLYIDDINIGDAPSAVEDMADVSSLNIFPNPGDGNCTVDVVLANAGKLNIALYDLEGQKVKQVFDGYLDSGETKLDMQAAELAPGIYIASATTRNSVTERKLVIR